MDTKQAIIGYTFFKNYKAHVRQTGERFLKSVAEEQVEINPNMIANLRALFNQLQPIISKEFLKSLRIDQALFDRYDYIDEILSATAIPLVLLIASLACLALSIWEGLQDLVIACRLIQAPGKHKVFEQTEATDYLFLYGISLTIAFATFGKALISLISRPIATAINQGCAEPETERFSYCGSPAS